MHQARATQMPELTGCLTIASRIRLQSNVSESAPGHSFMERRVMSVEASERIPIWAQLGRRPSDAPERGATAEVAATPDLGGVG